MTVLFESSIAGLPLLRRGKVREVYELGPDELLIVASDRLSAFDVVLPTPIPDKGRVLTQLSNFWFERTEAIVPNHLLETDWDRLPASLRAEGALPGRAVLVKRCQRIDVECVARGYLAGSAWTEYAALGTVAGETLAAGLRESERLGDPIFTPATKEESGHDRNISRAQLAALIGTELARELERVTLELYGFAHELALRRGLILADTKFEFGFDHGTLTLIDEVLTPDSSRFWPADTYEVGTSPPSFDKQFVRDYLETLDWDKKPPAPQLPSKIIEKTSEKYREALERLTR